MKTQTSAQRLHDARRRREFARRLTGLLSVLLAIGVAFLAPAALHSQTVSFAGTQTTLAGGFNFPLGVAVDGAGNVFVAEGENNRVVEIAAGSGAQTTVGSGLNHPCDVALDAAGDLFIADCGNNRLLKIPSGGGAQITIASDLNSPNGMTVDRAGDVFVALLNLALGGSGGITSNPTVMEIPASGGAQIRIDNGGLAGPTGLAVDGGGDVFVADFANNRVLKFPAGGGSQTTVGSGLNFPTGVAVDGAGNVFIADRENHRVVEVPANGGPQATVGSGLISPYGVAVDGLGNLFVTDDGHGDFVDGRVVEISLLSNAGNANVCPSGQTSPAPCTRMLTLNYNITADGTLGNPKVLTQGTPNLDFTLASGSTCTGDVTAESSCIVNVTFAPRAPGLRMGAVELTDSSGNVVVTTFIYGEGLGPAVAFDPGAPTTVASGLSTPIGVAVDAVGDFFVANGPGDSVLKFPAGGGAPTTVVSGLNYAQGVAVDGAGDVFVADANNNRVLKVPAGGDAQTTVGSGLYYPLGVAVDGAGDVFIADSGNSRVVKIPIGGGVQTSVGSGLSYPAGVAVDGAGDVFIADSNNSRVLKVPAGGGAQITLVSGLYDVFGVAVDAAGDVFIADSNNNRVLEISAGGAQTTVASGLNDPSGLAIDAAGNVFIADTFHSRVVELQRSLPPTLSFVATTVGSTSDSPQSVSVQNIGNQSLDSISPGLTITGANNSSFALVAGPGTPADCTTTFSLTPGASCNLSFSFTPQSSGTLQAAEVLTDNALNGNPATQSIGLTGTGQQLLQTITFNPIPNQILGSSLSPTASASSGLAVSFTSLTPSVCSVSGTSVTLLQPAACTIQASQLGNAIYSAAAPVTQTFSITDFSLTMTPASQTISSGHAASYTAALKSVDGFSGTVALSCSGGPPHSKCTVSPSSLALSSSSSAKVSVTLQSPQNVNHGTFPLTVAATFAPDTHVATVILTVK